MITLLIRWQECSGLSLAFCLKRSRSNMRCRKTLLISTVRHCWMRLGLLISSILRTCSMKRIIRCIVEIINSIIYFMILSFLLRESRISRCRVSMIKSSCRSRRTVRNRYRVLFVYYSSTI